MRIDKVQHLQSYADVLEVSRLSSVFSAKRNEGAVSVNQLHLSELNENQTLTLVLLRCLCTHRKNKFLDSLDAALFEFGHSSDVTGKYIT